MGRIDADSLYDRNDTGYYVDPASTSRQNVIRGTQIATGYHSLTSGYYAGGATPSTGYLITTNIDYGVFNMPIVIIEGYAYGNGAPIHLQIVWYAYSPDPSGWTSVSYINKGGWDPGTVSIGRNGSGKVCIHLSSNIYYGRFNVRGIYDQGHSYLENWSITEASTSGLSLIRTVGRATMQTDISGTAASETLATVTNRGNISTGDIYTPNASSYFRARYTAGSNNYHGSFNWYHLQLGNNGDNYIIAGRTATGGRLRFYVNNTSDFTSINGTEGMRLDSDGRLYSYVDTRSPLFYDQDNTGYYLNPNGTSNLLYITMPHRGNGTENILVNDGGSENWNAINIRGGANNHMGIGYHGTSRGVFGRDGFSIHFDETDSFRLHTNGWDTEFEVTGDGRAWLKDRLGINTTDFSYTSSDNSAAVGSNPTANKLFINGSIQLIGNNDAIVFGRGTSSFLKDEELAFGWGGGWFMQDSTWIRSRGSKNVYVDAYIRAQGSFRVGSEYSIWGTYGTYSAYISRLAYISLDWDAAYDSYSNHGLASTDLNGNFSDSVSLNSFNDIILRLDSNNNNTNSYVRFMDNSAGNGQFAYIGRENGSSIMELYGDIYANRFLDRNDSTYFLNPASDRDTSINGFTARTVEGTKGTWKYNIPRWAHTSDSNYWVGSMGWGTTDFNSVMTWGSGFFDTWSSPANSPGDASHWTGMQALHYTNAYNSAYGWQLAGGSTDSLWFRRFWPNSGGWFKVAMYDNTHSASRGFYASIYYDNDNTTYRVDPNGTSRLLTLQVDNIIQGGVQYAQRLDNVARTAITVGGNASTFYPVILNIGAGATVQQYGEFVIERGGYDDPGYSGIGFSTMNSETHGSTYTFSPTSTISDKASYERWQGGNIKYTGIIYSDSDVRAPIFSDISDTGYYINANSTSQLNRLQINNGLIAGGIDNGSVILYRASNPFSLGGTDAVLTLSDRSNNDWGLRIDKSAHDYGMYVEVSNGATYGYAVNNGGGWVYRVHGNGYIYAPYWYDINDTGYYVDPNGTSSMVTVYVSDWIYQRSSGGMYWTPYSRGIASPENVGNPYGTVATTNANGRNGWNGYALGSQMTLMHDYNNGGNTMGMHDTSYGWIWRWIRDSYFRVDRGYSEFANSARAPIFYDSDNTGYYINPASFTEIYGGLRMSGGHGDSTIRNRLLASNNGAGTGVVQLQMWCSEPGNTWDWAGFGYNVDNTYHDGSGPYYFSRPNTSFGQAYFRFSTSGHMYVYNTNTSGTRYTNMEFYASNWVYVNNYLEAGNSLRAPIFYDSNDTSYYSNQASTSIYNVIGTNKLRADTNRNYNDGNGWWGHDPYGYGWGLPHGSFRTLEISTSGNFSTEPAMFRLHQWGSGSPEFWKPQGTTLYLRETPIGGNIKHSNWFTRFYVQRYIETDESMRAPIFYDTDNTGYFTNPAGRSRLSEIDYGDGSYYWRSGSWGWRHQTPSGYIEFGPANTGHAHIYTDRSNFYFNVNELYGNGYHVIMHNLWWGNTYFGSGGDMYATIWYDTNDTGYRLDPNGSSRLNFVHTNNLYISAGNMLYSDSGGWQGEYNKLQWHSSHAYWQRLSGGYFIMRRGDGNDRNYFNDSGDIWMAYLGWMSSHLNQNVRTDAGPTFAEVYNNGWFRNNSNGTGLYNQNRGMHWYTNNGYWKSAGGGYGYGGIQFYNNYESDSRGYAGYWDGSGFGMLNSSGNWQIRIEYGNAHMELYRITYMNDARPYITYDRDNTGYYSDPNGTTNMYAITDYTRRAAFMLGRSNTNRRDITGDSNYWTGTQGWGTGYGNWDNAWSGGFNGWDIWGGGTAHPQGGGYVHAQGIVSGQHYSTSDGGAGYGWMMVGAADATANRYWARGKWGGGVSGWREFVMSDSNPGYYLYAYIMYDSNNTGYYCDPQSYSQFSSGEFNNYVRVARIDFIGTGGNSGQGTNAYNIFQEGGGWSYPYPDLRIAYHTGLKLGANAGSYEGTRVYSDYDMSDLCFTLAGSSNYSFKYKWQYTATAGYYSDYNGAHWYPNYASSYGSWRADGSRNGWYGISIGTGNQPHLMFDGSGNGGMYIQDYGRWTFYHSLGNNCTGFNTSSTSSSYGIYVEKGIYATGDVVAYSDRRKKENIETVDNPLDKLLRLRGVWYNRIDDETKKRNIGVIAQEVDEVLPEVVTYAEDVDEYGVAYGNFAGLFIEAIKEQNEIIKTQQKEIEELKEIVNKLILNNKG